MAWRVAKSLLKLIDDVNHAAPSRSKASDGTIGDASHQTRDSDHNPWVHDGSMGVVTAADITNDPAHGCDIQRIMDAIIASRDPRIKYMIHNRRIVSSTTSPWVWRPYSGMNPHEKHGHFSVKSDKAHYDSEAPWQIGSSATPHAEPAHPPVPAPHADPGPAPTSGHKRLIIGVHSAHDATVWVYQCMNKAVFRDNQFFCDKDEVADFLGTSISGAQQQPIRTLLGEAHADFMVAIQHLQDHRDPRAYVFVNSVEHV